MAKKKKNQPERKQAVIVINGRGGVGKHSLTSFVEQYFEVRNVSSITPIKKIAADAGWNYEKDDKGRQLLADLKNTFSRYNDLPFNYILEEYKKFVAVEQDVMFVHIREADEIAKFRAVVPCKTLLVIRDTGKGHLDTSEDTMFDYPYEYIFDNTAPLEKSGPKFLKLIKEIMKTDMELPLLEGLGTIQK
ncbi:MAG: hypothetical protein FWE16_02625 [Firmicutes bacterium]|nr:hypothetical protein [Bacillota bacterium]